MSEYRMRVSVACALMAAICPMKPARAQTAQELSHQLAAALQQRDLALRVLDSARRARAKSRTYPDTATLLGGIIIVPTMPQVTPVVRAAAAVADSVTRQRVGTHISAIPRMVFAIWPDTFPSQQGLVFVSNVTNGMEDHAQPIAADVATLSAMFEDNALRSLMIKRPGIWQWLGGGPSPDTVTVATWRTLRLELTSSPANVAHRCYAGDVSSCKVALGLIAEPDPVIAWYDSAARHEIVKQRASWGQLDEAPVRRCLAGRDVDCIALMRGSAALSAWSLPPASSRSRAALVALGLQAGGDGSLGAFLTGPYSVPEALASAAKVPADSLVAHWQRQVHDAGIASDAFTGSIAALSIGWILVMGGLASRSSRWR